MGRPKHNYRFWNRHEEEWDDLEAIVQIQQTLDDKGYIGAKSLGEIKQPFPRDPDDPYVYNKVDEYYDDIDDFYRDYMQGKFAGKRLHIVYHNPRVK